jgi:hypothetical protein
MRLVAASLVVAVAIGAIVFAAVQFTSGAGPSTISITLRPKHWPQPGQELRIVGTADLAPRGTLVRLLAGRSPKTLVPVGGPELVGPNGGYRFFVRPRRTTRYEVETAKGPRVKTKVYVLHVKRTRSGA